MNENGVNGNDSTIHRGVDEEAVSTDCPPVEDSSKYFNPWVRFMNNVRYSITEGIVVISTVAARNPRRTVWGVTLLTFFLAGVGMATNFNMDVAADAMYSTFTSRIREHQSWAETKSGFPAMSRNLRMIMYSVQGDKSVLTKKAVEGAFKIIDTVRQTTGYAEACAESDFEDADGTHTCNIRSVALFWNNSLDLFHETTATDVDVRLRVNKQFYPDGSPVDTLEVMGQAEVRGKNIIDARAFFLDVPLPADAMSFESEALANLLDLRAEWEKSPGPLRLEVLAYSSLEAETMRSVLNDIPLVPIVFVIMSLFTCFIFARRDPVRSRSLLGLGAVIAVFLSLVSGYGLMFIIGKDPDDCVRT
jgi:Patched family